MNVSNINSPKGLMALGATLEYDKTKLEDVKMGMGSGNWSIPLYNSGNGKLVTDRSDFGKTNETVFSITFKVKDGASGSAYINLKNISVADEDDEVPVSNASKTITIKAKDSGNQGGDSNNQGNTGNQGTQNNGNSNQGTTNNGGSTGTNSGTTTNRRPTTGTNQNDETTNTEETPKPEENTELEQRPEENEANIPDEVNVNDEEKKELEDVNLVKGKGRDKTLLFVLIGIVVILLIAIGVVLWLAKRKDKKTKKITQISSRDEDI